MLLKFLYIILLNIFVINCNEQPQYQVSIWMKHQGFNKNNGTHLCNGAIIHERLILTTADCLHYKVIGSNIVNPINTKMITVIAGSINTPAKSLIYANVKTIEIAKNFNATTLENDLAILILEESLPLDSRTDIKWIILDDHYDHKNNSCYVNFYNPTLFMKNIQQTQSVQIMENMNCTNSTNYSSPRKTDICSSYFVQTGSICNITADDINSSNDRGTALLCDSKLIGLLSHIIPRDLHMKCSELKSLNAIYTRVATYLDWIYSKIAIESIADSKLNHTMSPPYVASAPAQTISSQFPTNELTSNNNDTKIYSTTVIPATTINSIQIQSTTMKSSIPTTSTTSNLESQKHITINRNNNSSTNNGGNQTSTSKKNSSSGIIQSTVKFNILLTLIIRLIFL